MTFVVERAEKPKVVGPKPVLAPYESPRVELPKRGEHMGKTHWSDLEFLKGILDISRQVEDKTVSPHPSVLHKKHSQLLEVIEAAHGEPPDILPPSLPWLSPRHPSTSPFSTPPQSLIIPLVIISTHPPIPPTLHFILDSITSCPFLCPLSCVCRAHRCPYNCGSKRHDGFHPSRLSFTSHHSSDEHEHFQINSASHPNLRNPMEISSHYYNNQKPGFPMTDSSTMFSAGGCDEAAWGKDMLRCCESIEHRRIVAGGLSVVQMRGTGHYWSKVRILSHFPTGTPHLST